MINNLTNLVNSGNWTDARKIANDLRKQGEKSDIFWILNATIYNAENNPQGEYSCITLGLYNNPSNYELYFMLGNYYSSTNINQAYLCYEQAAFYCKNEDDLTFIKQNMEILKEMDGFCVNPLSFIILSYNISDIMKDCIQSIRENCPEASYEIVVVDNASTDGIDTWLKTQKDLKLILNEENKGFAGGCNQGIGIASENNDIFLLNNDTIVLPNSIFWLRMGLYERDSVGATGAVTNFSGNSQQVDETFDTVAQYIEYAKGINIPSLNPYENKVWLTGFAMLIKRCALDAVGLLDTRFEWGNYEDDDYGLRLTQAGYELLLCHNAFIYHYGSLNMAKDKVKLSKYMEINKQKFIDKWGFDITYYSMARKEIISCISSEKRDSISVLEVGCDCGSTLSRIKYLYPNAQTYGIELMENVSAFGGHMGNIVSGNIETMELTYEHNSFDYIIFGDVLEHLRDPYKVITMLRNFLKPGGKIIASIPNLMNITVILPLLKGDFTYTDAGLLDKTHIHLFTKNEIIKMFNSCGYSISEMKRIYMHDVYDYIEENKDEIDKLYSLPFIEDKKDFETFQYLVVADKN